MRYATYCKFKCLSIKCDNNLHIRHNTFNSYLHYREREREKKEQKGNTRKKKKLNEWMYRFFFLFFRSFDHHLKFDSSVKISFFFLLFLEKFFFFRRYFSSALYVTFIEENICKNISLFFSLHEFFFCTSCLSKILFGRCVSS